MNKLKRKNKPIKTIKQIQKEFKNIPQSEENLLVEKILELTYNLRIKWKVKDYGKDKISVVSVVYVEMDFDDIAGTGWNNIFSIDLYCSDNRLSISNYSGSNKSIYDIILSSLQFDSLFNSIMFNLKSFNNPTNFEEEKILQNKIAYNNCFGV